MRKAIACFCLFSTVLFFAAFPVSAAEKDIKIGVIYPLTGPAASTGQVLLEGVKLAADIINNKYNLNMPLAKGEGLPNLGGAKIVIVSGDHQAKPDVGMA